MAGNGTRFSLRKKENPEFSKPKPLIKVKNKPMIAWAVESFPKNNIDEFVFIVLKKHQIEHNVIGKLESIFKSDLQTVMVSEVTGGAAETALQAKKIIKKDDEIIVADSDQFLDTTQLLKAIKSRKNNVRGIIPVTKPPKGEEGKHSYSLSYDNLNVVRVAEKDPILASMGAMANIGAYYFASAYEYFEHVENMIKNNKLSGPEGRREYYVSGVYQDMIEAKKTVQIVTIDKGWRLGTPEEKEFFEKYYPKPYV